MPISSEISKEIQSITGPDVVRRKYLTELNVYTRRDTVVYATAFTNISSMKNQVNGALLSITGEDIQGFMSALHDLKGNKLDLIVHSPGGSAEATEQIINYLRKKYDHIRVIVPQNAMSAATMLACGADEILLAKHSALGPIDPQMVIPQGNGVNYMIPAQSILDEFDQAKSEVAANPKNAALWIQRISTYPHGFYKKCEDTIQYAQKIVEFWLANYMFNAAPGSPLPGTISKWLGESKNHLTHGKPIDIDTAKAQGLNVTALEADGVLQDLVLSVFHSTMRTFDVSPCVKLIENHNGKGVYSILQGRPF